MFGNISDFFIGAVISFIGMLFVVPIALFFVRLAGF